MNTAKREELARKDPSTLTRRERKALRQSIKAGRPARGYGAKRSRPVDLLFDMTGAIVGVRTRSEP